jgi:hypothetical protein
VERRWTSEGASRATASAPDPCPAGPAIKCTLFSSSIITCVKRTSWISDKPCTRTEDFRVDPVPKGCCILTVTKGNGQGKDEVRSFEVFLNGKSVVSSDHSPNAQAAVAVQTNNKIKLILTGEPSSKVFVLIAYDPRQSE